MLQRSPGRAVRYVKPIAPQWQRPSYDSWPMTSPSSPDASGLGGEQLDVCVLVRRSNHALESQPDLFEQPDRIRIRRRDDCDDPREPENFVPIAPHGARGLVRVALRAIFRQEGEADVHVREPVALDETAQAYGCARLAQLRHVHAETERLVARDRTIDYVSLRVRQRAHATIPDVADEVRIVDELEYEMVISSRRMTQNQSFGLKHFRHSRLRRSHCTLRLRFRSPSHRWCRRRRACRDHCDRYGEPGASPASRAGETNAGWQRRSRPPQPATRARQKHAATRRGRLPRQALVRRNRRRDRTSAPAPPSAPPCAGHRIRAGRAPRASAFPRARTGAP